MRLETVVLALVLAVPLVAQEAPSPRQSYQRAEALFAQGHIFTAEEEAGLTELRTSLTDSGDADLAASLDLLRLGSVASLEAAEARTQALTNLDHDTQLWVERERFAANRGFWRTVRDGGLIAFTASTVATLLLATTNDRNEALMRNGFFSNWAERRDFTNGMGWALVGSASTMFFSLFPLLWGEARQ